MSIGNEIVAWLKADGGVAAISGGRIHPDVLPDDVVMPAIRYTMMPDLPVYHLQGESDRTLARIRIDSFAATSIERTDLAAAIRAALSGHNGLLTTSIATIKLDFSNQLFDEDTSDYWVQQDFTISYR